MQSAAYRKQYIYAGFNVFLRRHALRAACHGGFIVVALLALGLLKIRPDSASKEY